MGSISVSCRYFYSNGRCANGSVSGEKCVGNDNCRIPGGNSTVETTAVHPGAPHGRTCEYDMGYGVYCRKYGKFFCAGKGNCESARDFTRSFDTHRKRMDGDLHGRKL